MRLLSHYEERLSVVPRWTIVRTIQQQTVDQHSYRVAIIATRLLDWWKSDGNVDASELMRYALLHDQFEAFSGDIPTPFGRLFNKNIIEQRFADCAEEVPKGTETIRNIVKAADYIEALIFLAVEKSLGNISVNRITADIGTNFHAHMTKCDQMHAYSGIMYHIGEFAKHSQDPLRRQP